MSLVQVASFADLDAATLYALLRLRVDVFVVEQNCPYPELDGRDTEPGTQHIWADDGTGPTSYLRLLDDGSVLRIGRVCTCLEARGIGLAAVLMKRALELAGPATVVMDAQSQLVDWYARFGFEVDGPEFLEDGIAHRPLRRG